MINAKDELLSKLQQIGKDVSDITAIVVRTGVPFSEASMWVMYNPTLDWVRENLDFTYNPGYGVQEVFGLVIFYDATWLSRGVYDGKEWWQYHKLPDFESVVEDIRREYI